MKTSRLPRRDFQFQHLHYTIPMFRLYSPEIFPKSRHFQEVPMLRKSGAFVMLAVVAALVTWNAPAALAQDAKTVLGNASKAMGADNVKTIQYSGTATEFAFGQAVNPSAAWPLFVEKSYARTINYETPGWRVEKVLADIPPDRKGGGLPPAAT